MGVAIGAGAVGGTDAASPVPFSKPLVIPRVLTGSNLTLTATQTSVQILPGAKTRMWTYNGTFPGPTIRRPTGQTTTGDAGQPAARRGRGADAPQPRQPLDDRRATASRMQFLAAPTGGSVTYTYTGKEAGGNERGAMQWYHDHRMDVTGQERLDGPRRHVHHRRPGGSADTARRASSTCRS